MGEDYDRGFRDGWAEVLLILLKTIDEGKINNIPALKRTLKSINRINNKIIEDRKNDTC